MDDMKEVEFSKEAEELAIKLAAFDIVQNACKEGKITEEELRYIAKKRGIPMDGLAL